MASTLKVGRILQTAALHTDPTMRAMAVRYGYYLWQHDRDAGFADCWHFLTPGHRTIFDSAPLVSPDSKVRQVVERLAV